MDENIIKILSNEFIILSNYNTQDKLDDGSFGYSSTHLVCTLKNEWLTLPSFSELNKIKFEIQIRTVSQHSWADRCKNQDLYNSQRYRSVQHN